MDEQGNQDTRRTIFLISCCGPKAEQPSKAEDMYRSALFKMSLSYAKKRADVSHIFILSAKYGLLGLGDEIEPYNETLKSKPVSVRRQWSMDVLKELSAKGFDLANDKFVILAGDKYIEYLVEGRNRHSLGCQQIKNADMPLDGMRIGLRLRQLNTLLAQWHTKGF